MSLSEDPPPMPLGMCREYVMLRQQSGRLDVVRNGETISTLEFESTSVPDPNLYAPAAEISFEDAQGAELAHVSFEEKEIITVRGVVVKGKGYVTWHA